MEQITPKQAVANAIIACRVEALRARARGTHTVADEWEDHASTIRNLEARLAEAEKRKVPEGWEPFSIHEQRGGVVDLFFGCGEDGHTAEWLYSLSDDGAYFCTGIPDRSKWNDAIRVARERGGVELTGSRTGIPRGVAETAAEEADRE